MKIDIKEHIFGKKDYLPLFSNNLRYKLHFLRLPRRDFCRRAQCSLTALHKWENGEAWPTSEQYENIKKIFVCSDDELLLPPVSDVEPEKVDGYTITEWRARALVAEHLVQRQREIIDKLSKE